MENPELRTLSLRLPADVVDEIHAQCQIRGESVSEAIVRWLRILDVLEVEAQKAQIPLEVYVDILTRGKYLNTHTTMTVSDLQAIKAELKEIGYRLVKTQSQKKNPPPEYSGGGL